MPPIRPEISGNAAEPRGRGLRLSTALLLLALMVLGASQRADAQFPAPLATPNLNLSEAANVRALVRLADGRLIAGGDFHTVNGEQRRYLVRLLADGEIDTTWNPAPNNTVTALHVDALGRLYVAGIFTQIGGQPRTRLARFDATGVLDSTWTPSLNNATNAITPGVAGEICFGGVFTSVNGTARNRLACLSELDGTLNTTWNPDPNGTVVALHNANGTMYFGGFFTMVGTASRQYLARAAVIGTGAPDSWNPAPNNQPQGFVPGASATQLYIIGQFGGIFGTARPGIALISTTTGLLDSTFAPTSSGNSSVYGAVADGGGGVYVVGSFDSIGGQSRANVARLAFTGAAVAAWNPGVTEGYVTEILREPDGDVVIGGPFSVVGGGEHLSLARVQPSGTVDPQFNTATEVTSDAFAIARVPGEGSLVVGGAFTRANGLIRRRLLKVLANGQIDPNWTPEANDEIRGLTVDTLGRVYVSGYFSSVDGAARSGLARLLNTPDGAVDPGWNPSPHFGPDRLVLRPEGLYINAGAGSNNYIARLSTGTTATVDAAWNPAPNQSVRDIVVTLDGALVVSGSFATIGGIPRPRLARISTGATATVDPLWAPTVNIVGDTGISLAQHDNSIYLTGDFDMVNGVPRSRLAKISAVGAGALDVLWAPSLTATQGYGLALATDDDHLYVAGNAGGGFFRPFLARYEHGDIGQRDPTWRPAPDGGLFTVLPDNDRVCVGGFTLRTLGGQTRNGFGCLPKLGVDAIFADSHEGDEE